jgi:hypothetical protein
MNSPDDTVNQPPYVVTALVSNVVYGQGSGLQTIQLLIAEQDGLKDPDGDTVYFKSSSLPSWISLDENTGEVTVDTTDTHAAEDFDFWSEDEHGADSSDTPHTITISVEFT